MAIFRVNKLIYSRGYHVFFFRTYRIPLIILIQSDHQVGWVKVKQSRCASCDPIRANCSSKSYLNHLLLATGANYFWKTYLEMLEDLGWCSWWLSWEAEQTDTPKTNKRRRWSNFHWLDFESQYVSALQRVIYRFWISYITVAGRRCTWKQLNF